MAQTIFRLSTVLTYSLIPSSIIVVLNILMIKKLIAQRMFRIKNQIGQPKKSAANSRSLTLTMFAVCFVFIVTTLPGMTLLFIKSVSKLLKTDFIVSDSPFFIIIERIYLINHSINFVLYCVTGSLFRQTLVRLFTCHSKRKSTRCSTQKCPTVQESVL